MTTHHHDDPAAEGAARAAQLVAMTLSIAEGVARLRSERLAARAIDDERVAAASRAQHRVEQAAEWLDGRPGGSRQPRPGAAHGPGSPPEAGPHPGAVPASGSVTIICTPRDVADQAFPVPMPEAMATAPQAARDAVHTITSLPTARARPVPGSKPAPSRRQAGPR